MARKLDGARELLARANRMIANEGVLDAFGHVTMRHPDDPQRYLMSRSRATELVQPEDVLEFTLDSQPVKPSDVRLYGERVIHGGIYQARPDVNAVCHHHASSILPFCISGMELKPVFHLGATLGEKVPFWDARDEFGDTTLIVTKPEEGASLARALGAHWIVLMRAPSISRRWRSQLSCDSVVSASCNLLKQARRMRDRISRAAASVNVMAMSWRSCVGSPPLWLAGSR